MVEIPGPYLQVKEKDVEKTSKPQVFCVVWFWIPIGSGCETPIETKIAPQNHVWKIFLLKWFLFILGHVNFGVKEVDWEVEVSLQNHCNLTPFARILKNDNLLFF